MKAMPVELDEGERAELESCARGLRGIIEGAEKELIADQALRKALDADNGS